MNNDERIAEVAVEKIFKLSEDWGNLPEQGGLVPFGVGRIGRRVIPTLIKEFDIPFLIDNGKHEARVYDLEVFGIEDALSRLKAEGLKIVVTTVRYSYEDISRKLTELGFEEYRDYCLFERFAQEWNLRWKNRCVLSKIDTVITSGCSLKCTNCNMFISHIAESYDMGLESLKRNFDIFFDSVDYVYEYTLLGGEPFIHKNLTEIISYMGDTYGERIGRINLISNGTIVPRDEVIQTMHKYYVTVHISDYTCSVPYGNRLREVTDRFLQAGIEHYVIPNNTWKDIVYPKTTYTAADPKKHMLLCGHSTHSVNNGRLYWCDPAFAAECFMGFPSKEDDFLDLAENKKKNTKFEASINIFKYLLGEVNERGYMSICEKCAGVGRDNDRIVQAGLQKKTDTI